MTGSLLLRSSLLLFCVACANCKLPYPQSDLLKIDADNAQTVFDTNEYWLVKFYAPQCVHCKRIWSTVMNVKIDVQIDEKRRVYFGEVNCDDTNGRRVCEKYDVLKIPQLKLFKGSELLSTYSYTTNDERFIKKWINYVTTPVFWAVHSEEELNSCQTDDNFFLTCSENLSDDLIKAAKLYSEECFFINIKNGELCDKLNIKANHLHVGGAEEHATYDLSKIDFEELKSFMNKNRFPLVSKVDHHTFFNLRSSGNNLILLLLDLEKGLNAHLSQFTHYAKRHKRLGEFIFAYIDGKYYEENLELYGTDARKYPQIIVFSKRPHEYYFEDYFDLDHLDDVIDQIVKGSLKAKTETFTKSTILLTQLKKHINYIIEKAFKTDFTSFVGFFCFVIMIILTSVLVVHTIYKFINGPGTAAHAKEKKKNK
ncbi:protein disulfide isomerase, putative [Plasmodium vivax]|uniref:Thioredoxin domain-containing protein n=6 Tax=Plasmodium vivax TaxID=5855 RepID=A5K4T5_PLAVS|nr:hypothetical protein, conserved [Plasmodium vivax]KMZ86627.1 hypothetical protein PVBG_04963 [Plasmodium vivax Brazil I]KMZ93077.1 hypothetical protein PVMG_04227 [Plasmodium vivax Mauritania I]KMZ99537.1 hypothetical protein PVNG_02264 [Plasmodium vivax North Korean]EDL45663.1 hypothetical protein, conserved [Plasmodium vivax]CAG9476969.1 unnamed protein product [Plasmodium vivax]|eukprot:XP_001615390.1 hypothetical protein [Plasmodium vivax Sal-1]